MLLSLRGGRIPKDPNESLIEASKSKRYRDWEGLQFRDWRQGL
jgi:hypothetical protein